MNGETILVSAFGCNYNSLTSPEIFRHFLVRAVEHLNMTPVLDTLTVRTFPTEDGRGDFGVSGFIILTESHLSGHTWPEKRFARIEFSSCRAQKDSETKLKNLVEIFFGSNNIKIEKLSW